MSIIRKKDKEYPVENEILERKKDQIDFLRDNAEEFLEQREILKPEERLMLTYNLLKYYLVLLKGLKESLNVNQLDKLHPGLKWK